MDKLHERDAEPESGPRKRAKPEPPTKATNTYTLPASISYKQVASKFPELQEHLIQETNSNDHYTLDFQDPLAVRTLNRALLHVYFDLQIHLPRTNLCPTVANRLSYVEWINSAILCDFYPSTNRVVRGLDIGCGASCIYPLLGSRVLQGCSFVGTDVRADSISIARDNVRANGLEPRIQLFLNKRINTTLPFDDHDDADNAGFFSQLPVDADGSVFTFSMCNPPFYSDHAERERLRGFKEHGPGLNTCGEDEELYTLGGEQGFLGRMVDESIRWGPY
ncbi:Methyltransferase-like protein 16, partial [Coemansia erecta]